MNAFITILAAVMVVSLSINPAIANEKTYIPFDIKSAAMDFEACLEFISQSSQAASNVGLELGEPEIIAEDIDNRLLVVKFPMKSPAGPGFALVTCVDGALVRGQYLYDQET